MLDALLHALLAEGWAAPPSALPADAAGKRHLLRTLMNTRPPLPARPELIGLQDRLLSAERASAAVTDAHRLPTIRQMFGDGPVPCQRTLPWSYRIYENPLGEAGRASGRIGGSASGIPVNRNAEHQFARPRHGGGP